jgi:hypothetical protein
MVLCIDYSVLALNHPRNILFQTMLINILDPFALFGKYRFHLKTLCILSELLGVVWWMSK